MVNPPGNGSTVQATLGDLALGIARLEGKLDTLTQTTSLQLNNFNSLLTEAGQDRREMHKDIEALKAWRAWLTGVGFAIGLMSGATALHSFGIGIHP